MTNWIRPLTGRRWLGVMVYLLLIAAIGWAVASLVLGWTSPANNKISYIAGVWQPFITICAIAIGGIVAIYKLQVFRDLEPHLTVSQAISHRFIGDSYAHIDVTILLKNSSKVEMEVREGLFRLQHIVPMSDDDVEYLYEQVFVKKDYKEIQWPTIVEDRREWDENEFIIEPGETHQETVDFIVSVADVDSVLIYTYFYNSRFFQGSRSAEGWGAATTYDIVDGKQTGGSARM